MNAGYLTLEQASSFLCPRIIIPDTMWTDTVYVIATETNTVENYSSLGRLIFRVVDNPELPVDLIDFTGEKNGSHILLKWQIANPDNFWKFELQRSIHLQDSGVPDWIPIESIELFNGESYYEYVDKQPDWSDNYYRLKMVDFDYSFEYSNIIQVSFEETKKVQINFFPNPVAEQLFHLDVSTESIIPIELIIVNGSGEIMYSQTFESTGNRQLIPIDIERYASGLYWARIKIGCCVANRCFSEKKD